MPNLTDCTSVICLEEGLHLRLSYFPFPVYITSMEDEETGQTEMFGIVPQHILPFVLRSLNISYDFVLADQFSHGVPVVNGTWPGEMGLLQTKVADICVGAHYIDYYHVLDFCALESYERIPIKFLASYGTQEMFDFFTFLYEINEKIWLLILVAFVSIVTLSSISDTNYAGPWKTSVFKRKMWKSLWIYLASIFCEGSPHTMSSRLGQLLQFLWLFSVLVFVNILYGQFKGILMVKHGADYLHSIEDLAKSSNFLPLILRSSILEYVLRDSPLEAYRRVYERALIEPERCFIDGNQLVDIKIFQMVKYGTHVLLGSESIAKYILKEMCHILTGNRKLYFIEEDVTYTDAVFYTNWDFPEYLRDRINERLLIMKEGGFGELWFSKYFRDFEKCQESDPSDSGKDMLLKLKHLHTAIILFVYLLIQAFVIFLFEKGFTVFERAKKFNWNKEYLK